MVLGVRAGRATIALVAVILIGGPAPVGTVGAAGVPTADRAIDGVGRTAELVAAVAPASAPDDAVPFVCEIMDMTAFATDADDPAPITTASR